MSLDNIIHILAFHTESTFTLHYRSIWGSTIQWRDQKILCKSLTDASTAPSSADTPTERQTPSESSVSDQLKQAALNLQESDKYDAASGVPMPPGRPFRPGLTWKVGARIEARDFLDKWYQAKINDIDDKDQTVLVHFDGWNTRYDEWIKMESDRLRPITRHSERKERKEKPKVVQSKADHKMGDHVFAKWTDCRMYPALIIALNSNGSYEVLFYDGFKKSVQPINIRTMPPDVQKQYSKAGLLPEPGKKIKQKVKELMDSVTGFPPPPALPGTSKDPKDRRLSKGNEESHDMESNSGDSLFKDGKKDSEKDVAEPECSSSLTLKMPAKAVKRKRDSLSPAPQLKRSRRRSEDIKTEGKEEEIEEEKKSRGEKKDKKLGSKKKKSLRSPAIKKEAQIDEDIISHVDIPDCVSEIVEDPRTNAESVPPQEPTIKAEPMDVSEMDLAPPKAFKVLDDHNTYKCPFSNCNKGFRKLSLVEYHVKYYHSEDGEKINITPIPRKRKKTASMCSTDSEISVGGSAVKPPVLKAPKIEAETLAPITSEIVPSSSTDNLTAQGELDRLAVIPAVKDIKQSISTIPEDVEEEDEEDFDDKLRSDDVVNCICQINEENGLMIQCDVCLCWQHAVCMEITEETLPKKYVCYVCCNPPGDSPLRHILSISQIFIVTFCPGVRESARFNYDQDWLKQGTMVRFNFLPEESLAARKSEIMQATHELVADLIKVHRVLISTRNNLHHLQSKNITEINKWTKNWGDEEEEEEEEERREHLLSECSDAAVDVELDVVETAKENSTEAQHNQPPQTEKSGSLEQTMATGNGTAEESIATENGSAESSMASENGAAGNSTATENGSAEKSLADDSLDGKDVMSTPNICDDQENTDDSKTDNQPSAELDSSGTETASNLSALNAEEDPTLTDTEDAVEDHTEENALAKCERNLLEYIRSMQDKVEEQLDVIDDQVSLLESEDNGSRQGEHILRDLPRVKKALHQLLADLVKVKRMSLFHR
ncbi:hypothetical protein CAPTEDRAFT_222293 [Capitella teleta]|uniref:C2H2-type domain-containing protein n=1 Tax=Capitella teleta TaxID=283909 RepID=R7U0K5_CAPTE|nr:hypothetical protein CAPTEDRAFT_222293 [Capitella teleta]|eukprot:ELT97191.1 hypothetical protein CAPTEDRAFT_222293 [Capitella teleta]